MNLTHLISDSFSRIPGLAFRNQRRYLELQQVELLALSSTEIQTQFYKVNIVQMKEFMLNYCYIVVLFKGYVAN